MGWVEFLSGEPFSHVISALVSANHRLQLLKLGDKTNLPYLSFRCLISCLNDKNVIKIGLGPSVYQVCTKDILLYDWASSFEDFITFPQCHELQSKPLLKPMEDIPDANYGTCHNLSHLSLTP